MKKLWKWLCWNLANFLSASRFLSPLIHSELWSSVSIEMTWVFILALCLTDLLDGWVARKIGNTEGIGMKLDTIADKTMILSVSFWILQKVENVDLEIMIMIISGEFLPFFIGIIGVGLAWKKNRKQGFSAIDKEIKKRWKINEAGRKAMVFYFAMAIFIFLQVIFPQIPVFRNLYWTAFLGGFILRIISSVLYAFNLSNWIKEYKTTV